jgi:hypothetical protein
MLHEIVEYDKDTEFIIESILTVPDEFLPKIKDMIAFNDDDIDLIYCYKLTPYQVAEIALIVGAEFQVNNKDNHFFFEPTD